MDVWQDSETSYSKSNLGKFQHWYLADMLASVYSYRGMVKSVSSCCVRGRRVLSNPVTIIAMINFLYDYSGQEVIQCTLEKSWAYITTIHM